MAQEFLNRPYVIAILEQMGGERAAPPVRPFAEGDRSQPSGFRLASRGQKVWKGRGLRLCLAAA
jgi:hypothetical protein